MIARIHHLKHGTEYVLQYNTRSDTIELRIIKYTLLGRWGLISLSEKRLTTFSAAAFSPS